MQDSQGVRLAVSHSLELELEHMMYINEYRTDAQCVRFVQALLEAPSIETRFKLGLTALRKHRKVLAALSSLKSLEDM